MKFFTLHKFIGDIAWMCGGAEPESDNEDGEDVRVLSAKNWQVLQEKLTCSEHFVAQQSALEEHVYIFWQPLGVRLLCCQCSAPYSSCSLNIKLNLLHSPFFVFSDLDRLLIGELDCGVKWVRAGTLEPRDRPDISRVPTMDAHSRTRSEAAPAVVSSSTSLDRVFDRSVLIFVRATMILGKLKILYIHPTVT